MAYLSVRCRPIAWLERTVRLDDEVTETAVSLRIEKPEIVCTPNNYHHILRSRPKCTDTIRCPETALHVKTPSNVYDERTRILGQSPLHGMRHGGIPKCLRIEQKHRSISFPSMRPERVRHLGGHLFHEPIPLLSVSRIRLGIGKRRKKSARLHTQGIQ